MLAEICWGDLYRVSEKSPHTKQCASIMNFNHLCTSWLHFHWISVFTLMLDTSGCVSISTVTCVGVSVS